MLAMRKAEQTGAPTEETLPAILLTKVRALALGVSPLIFFVLMSSPFLVTTSSFVSSSTVLLTELILASVPVTRLDTVSRKFFVSVALSPVDL